MTGKHTCNPIFKKCHLKNVSSCEELTCFSCPPGRDDFSVKLALLSNQWQCVVRRAQQRRGIIDSLVRQWQNYREMAEKLLQWLQEVTRDPDVHQPGEPVALQQARNLLDHIQVGDNTSPSLHLILIFSEMSLSKIFMLYYLCKSPF